MISFAVCDDAYHQGVSPLKSNVVWLIMYWWFVPFDPPAG
jgi:hypothetical protein